MLKVVALKSKPWLSPSSCKKESKSKSLSTSLETSGLTKSNPSILRLPGSMPYDPFWDASAWGGGTGAETGAGAGAGAALFCGACAGPAVFCPFLLKLAALALALTGVIGVGVGASPSCALSAAGVAPAAFKFELDFFWLAAW